MRGRARWPAFVVRGGGSFRVAYLLHADPDGTGSLNQRITARMTNQLMGDLGQPSKMSAQDVKDVEKRVAKGDSYLEMPDVVRHPKAEQEPEEDE